MDYLIGKGIVTLGRVYQELAEKVVDDLESRE